MGVFYEKGVLEYFLKSHVKTSMSEFFCNSYQGDCNTAVFVIWQNAISNEHIRRLLLKPARWSNF